MISLICKVILLYQNLRLSAILYFLPLQDNIDHFFITLIGTGKAYSIYLKVYIG